MDVFLYSPAKTKPISHHHMHGTTVMISTCVVLLKGSRFEVLLLTTDTPELARSKLFSSFTALLHSGCWQKRIVPGEKDSSLRRKRIVPLSFLPRYYAVRCWRKRIVPAGEKESSAWAKEVSSPSVITRSECTKATQIES